MLPQQHEVENKVMNISTILMNIQREMGSKLENVSAMFTNFQSQIRSDFDELNETLQNTPIVSKVFPFTKIEPFGSYLLFPGTSDYDSGTDICDKLNSYLLDFTNENYHAKLNSVYSALNLGSQSINDFYIGTYRYGITPDYKDK